MLPIEKKLGEIILDLIKTDPKSISGITRELNETGYNFHKLVVTGYLHALNDFGYVRQRDLPPSKIYYKTTPHKKDIYESVGEKVSDLDLSKRNQILVALYIFQRLFHSPIFRHELVRCGFAIDFEAPAADPERTAEARKSLAKSGVKISRKEPAFETELTYEPDFQNIMMEILSEQFGIKRISEDGTQSRLETE